MNPDTGAIRAIPDDEEPMPREIPMTELEAKILATYRPEFRPQLLQRWRSGRLQLLVEADGRGRLVDMESKPQRRIRETLEHWKSKKARRRLAAASRRKNRR